MRRKFELEDETRTALQPSDGAVVGYQVPVAYPDPLPSPAPAFVSLDQISTGPAGYWPHVPSRDVAASGAGRKSGQDATVLPDFSEWLGPGTYSSSVPAVTHTLRYPSFGLKVSDNNLTFHPSSHATSPLYSLVPSESASLQNRHSPMSAQEAQTVMPHPTARRHPSDIDQSHAMSQQQLKQASPLLMQHQQMFNPSAASSTPAHQSGSETSLLSQHLIMDYHQRNPDGLAVCDSLVASAG